MSSHIQVGKLGEALAARWLCANGYTILHRNWRHGRYEVDIIASKGGVIHIVEIKCRRSSAYGPPEESVSRKKIRHILQGAGSWLHQHPGHRRVQYDVLAITLRKNADPEYLLIGDVYL